MIVDIAGGAVIGCDDFGNSSHPAVILTGGLATQRTVWPVSPCTALVDAGYRVIRFDKRDTGESTWSKAPSGADPLRMVQSGFGLNDQFAYTIDGLADDVVALIDALKIEGARCWHVLRWSYRPSCCDAPPPTNCGVSLDDADNW